MFMVGGKNPRLVAGEKKWAGSRAAAARESIVPPGSRREEEEGEETNPDSRTGDRRPERNVQPFTRGVNTRDCGGGSQAHVW